MNFEMNRVFGFVFFVTLVLCANALPRFTENNHKFEDGELFEIKSDAQDTVGHLECYYFKSYFFYFSFTFLSYRKML